MGTPISFPKIPNIPQRLICSLGAIFAGRSVRLDIKDAPPIFTSFVKVNGICLGDVKIKQITNVK
jgi:hypothetical protein